MSNLTEFKKDLKALLIKHNASIDVGFDDCSDTHGMTGEHMTVTLPDKNNHWGKSIKICDGWGIGKSDI